MRTSTFAPLQASPTLEEAPYALAAQGALHSMRPPGSGTRVQLPSWWLSLGHTLRAHPYEHTASSHPGSQHQVVRIRAHALTQDLPCRPPLPGRQREGSFCGKQQTNFGARLPKFKSQLPDFTGGVTSLSFSSDNCGGGHWKAEEMGLQALHPAQGTRGCHQVASIIALTAGEFMCSGLEP